MKSNLAKRLLGLFLATGGIVPLVSTSERTFACDIVTMRMQLKDAAMQEIFDRHYSELCTELSQQGFEKCEDSRFFVYLLDKINTQEKPSVHKQRVIDFMTSINLRSREEKRADIASARALFADDGDKLSVLLNLIDPSGKLRGRDCFSPASSEPSGKPGAFKKKPGKGKYGVSRDKKYAAGLADSGDI